MQSGEDLTSFSRNKPTNFLGEKSKMKLSGLSQFFLKIVVGLESNLVKEKARQSWFVNSEKKGTMCYNAKQRTISLRFVSQMTISSYRRTIRTLHLYRFYKVTSVLRSRIFHLSWPTDGNGTDLSSLRRWRYCVVVEWDLASKAARTPRPHSIFWITALPPKLKSRTEKTTPATQAKTYQIGAGAGAPEIDR